MIQLYAFPSDLTSSILAAESVTSIQHILQILHFSCDYNKPEYTQLTQSPLRHDIFINEISDDLAGEVISLSHSTKDKAILIRNQRLAKILKTFDAIQEASGLRSTSPDLPTFIIDFLRLSCSKGYDLLSTSDLSWKYGD